MTSAETTKRECLKTWILVLWTVELFPTMLSWVWDLHFAFTHSDPMWKTPREVVYELPQRLLFEPTIWLVIESYGRWRRTPYILGAYAVGAVAAYVLYRRFSHREPAQQGAVA